MRTRALLRHLPACMYLLLTALLLRAPLLQAQPADAPDAQPTASGAAEEYRLAPGDSLKVHVLGQPDLTVEVQVSDSESIIYPLLGELKVVGLTRQETEALIHKRLKGPYLIEPAVSVTIIAYRQVFVQGAVQKPGPYPYVPGLTLQRAILNAGGFSDTAAKGKIFVSSEFQPAAEPRKVDMGYQLRPGDIITVKTSFF